MEITDLIRANHRSLSGVSEAFLDYIVQNPDCTSPHSYREYQVPDVLKNLGVTIQSWPTFLGKEKRAEIERAANGIPRLLATIPERIFKNDMEKISQFYGINDAMLTKIILSPPTGMDGLMARGDFLDTSSGFKCIEANAGGSIGGMRMYAWSDMYSNDAHISGFLEKEGVKAAPRHPMHVLFEQIIGYVTGKGIAKKDVNIVIAIDSDQILPGLTQYLNQEYQLTIKKLGKGFSGKAIACSYKDLKMVGKGVYYQTTRVHAIVEHTTVRVPTHIFRAFKGGLVHLFNGPVGYIMNHKNNLALLSQHEDSPLYSDEEQAIIRNHIAWSRVLEPTTTLYQGRKFKIPEDLIAERASFVVKASQGARGVGVYVGAFLSQKEWEQIVNKRIKENGWLVQEYLTPRQHIYQDVKRGFAPHDIVWGMYSFGGVYGSGFLRMTTREPDSTGVINASLGASVGIIFEV